MNLLSKLFGTRKSECACGLDLDKEIAKTKSETCCEPVEDTTKKKSGCCSFDLDAEIAKAKEQ